MCIRDRVSADKMRGAVMGTLLVIPTDIAVLFPLIGLVTLLIHDTAVVCTEQYAGEQAHFIIAVGAFALLAKLLHPFPCLGVYDRLVVDVYKRQVQAVSHPFRSP